MRFIDLDVSEFENSLVFLDIDGTLVVDKSTVIDLPEKNKLENLILKSKVYLCSNGKNGDFFSKQWSLPYVPNKKPFVGSKVKELINNYKKDNIKRYVVGDKFLTDGIFAIMSRSVFVKIDHLVRGNRTLFEKLSYFLDDTIWFLYQAFLLLRPFSWVKNLLIFAPVFFAGVFFREEILVNSVIAFCVFCLSSSFVYVLNDIKDHAVDKNHISKKYRPVASGNIGFTSAYLLSLFLYVLAFSLMYFVPSLFIPITIYIVLNGLYTLWLKHVYVLDIILVAVFYILRIITGGVVAGVYVSPWIIMCAFFGSLFVITGKRRAEHSKEHRREVLNNYSDKALDYILAISSSLAVMGYAVWSVVEHDSEHLVYSTIFVVFCLFRILNRVYTHPEDAESPEALVFKDKYVLSAFVSWIVFMLFIFYK